MSVESDIQSSGVTAKTSTDTVDFGGKAPPRPAPVPEDIDAYLAHLEDACPVITYDPIEAAEFHARYLIGAEIGSGAIGQVIDAFDAHLGRHVAIKILHGGDGVSRDRLARFVAEAQITAQLEHPAVVPVHEIGRMPGGMPYFAMKLVKGQSLDDIINNLRVGDEAYRRRYSGKGLVRIFLRLCQGVAYAHHKGVVHRDLKPANILIGEYGEVQIMDWGLAKILGEAAPDEPEPVRTVRDAPDLGTLDGAIAGTPAYMSPEQARGEADQVGPRSDVFSLGLLLAEMLTLVRVFRGAEPGQTLEDVRRTRAVDVAELNPNARVDPELAAVILKCTQPSPGLRYCNAEEVAEDLRHYLEDRELSISPDVSHRKVMKWTRRNPFAAGAALAASAILALEAVVWLCRVLFRG